MKLSISNIGWSAEDDLEVYNLMKRYGYVGLEIAPTRIFPKEPYKKLNEAKIWRQRLKENFDFCVSSMQSIWYGRQENIFGTVEDRRALTEYTMKAIDFAQTVGCGNLVFGCPKNRLLPEGKKPDVAVDFFKKIGDYAVSRNTMVGFEANPSIYGTNFINNTELALRLVKQVDSKGFLLNLDVGTMIYNQETILGLKGNVGCINHVHISEPQLNPIKKNKLHTELKELLSAEGYTGFISIEMKRVDSLSEIEKIMEYVASIYC